MQVTIEEEDPRGAGCDGCSEEQGPFYVTGSAGCTYLCLACYQQAVREHAARELERLASSAA